MTAERSLNLALTFFLSLLLVNARAAGIGAKAKATYKENVQRQMWPGGRGRLACPNPIGLPHGRCG